MEKVKFKYSRGKTLAGILYPVESDKIIIVCHGYTSDKYMEGRTEVLAGKLNASGFNCLAFDFAGCGESDDDSISLTKEVDDLNSAICYVKALGYSKIAFYGHSLGALVCLMAFSSEIRTMVLSAPLTDTIIDKVKSHYPEKDFEELIKNGVITLNVKNGPRNSIVIDKQMIFDFENINQQKILSNVKCPVLIIHGNAGPDEPMLLAKTKKGMKFFSAESKLKIVDGAGHNFGNHIKTLTGLTNDWFNKYFQ